MPRTSCSQPPPSSSSSLSSLLSLIQPQPSSATSTTSILHNAVRSLANEQSASPLIRTLSAIERRLVQLTDADTAADDEWQTKVGEQLAAMCDVLQRIDSTTVARPLNELFPELDHLLLALLTRIDTDGASATRRSLLIACCDLLVRATGSTTTTAAWPRWLLSSPSRPTDEDRALAGSLSATLSAAQPDPGLLFASCALLASLCSSSHHATLVSASLSSSRLLPVLCRLYQQQCALVVQRVQALTERGQRRLLDDMWADGGRQEWLVATGERDGVTALSDRQQLLLLSRLQTSIEALIRCGRHAPRHKAACDLCNSTALFNALLASVVSLWDCLPAVSHNSSNGVMSDRVRGLSLSALTLMYEATCKSKQQVRGSNEVVGHISVMGQLLDPASNSAASFYPLLLTVVEQLTQWLPESPLMCTTVLGSVASAILEIAMAQRQKTESRVDPQPARPSTTEPTTKQRLDLAPLMRALLIAATECMRIVQMDAAPAELIDRMDSCMQATLEAHAYFVRHSSHLDATMMPAFLAQTWLCLVPLARSILSLTAAATGQPLSAVAVLAVNLERLINCSELWHLTQQLLTCVVQHGLIGWSWRAREVLQRLSGQYQQQAKDSTQFKQLDTAHRCFDRYLGKLMAATGWWQHDRRDQLRRSEEWVAALDTLFGAHTTCLNLIESLQSFPSWRTGANTRASDQLCLILTLSIMLLLNQPHGVSREQHDHEQNRHAPVSSDQQLVMDYKKLVSSIEQLLMDQKQKQPATTSSRSTILSRSALLHLCLVLLLVERLHRHSASTRAKNALFGFLAASHVSATDVELTPPLKCCVRESCLCEWLWQQSTANQGAVQLHDQLLSSILSPPADSRATISHPPSFPASKGADSRLDRIQQTLSSAAKSLEAAEAAGPLQALVRRWRVVVQRWRDCQLSHEDGSIVAPPRRSEEVEELLLCSAYLMNSCARKLATLDLLEPITQLLASNYHRLLLTSTAVADERLFPAVDAAAWLVHTLVSLLSASAVPQHTPSAQLGRVFDAACYLLLASTTSDVESSTAVESVLVGRSCVRLMNTVLECATTSHHATLNLLRSFTSHEQSRSSMAKLIDTGFSPVLWAATEITVSSRAIRVHLPQAPNAGSDELLQLFRLQLQVECMRLCTTLLLSSTDVAYAMLDWEQCMSVLSHPCDEMKAAAFHYLAACFNCRVLRFERPAGDEQKYDEDDEDWTPTKKDMSSAQTLLLIIQACLYPRQRLALSSAALDVLQAMLESSTTSQQQELLDQPWHAFIVHSCLLALAMRPPVHSTADERDHRICQLYRYLFLLTSEETGNVFDADQSRQKCVMQRHLEDVDSRLVQPLIFLPAIDDQPASQSPAVLCRTTVYHYLTLLQHLHRSQLILPRRVRVQLRTHLQTLESIIKASCMAAVCPAAAKGVVDEKEPGNELTADVCTVSSGGSHEQPLSLSQSQHQSASQHTGYAFSSADDTHSTTAPDQRKGAFTMQCVCGSAVAGAGLIVNKCIEAIDKLLESLQN